MAAPEAPPTRRTSTKNVSEQVINSALAKLYGSLVEQSSQERAEFHLLKRQVNDLRVRLTKIESQFTAEKTFDHEIECEIKAIGAETSDVSSLAPEDWLPDANELDRLLEED